MAVDQILVAPSILSADFANLGQEVKAVQKAGADWVHVDIMDGHFVDNLTIGPPVVASIRKVSKLPLDVHLMIERPELTVDRYIKAGARGITIHVESTDVAEETLKKIRDLGVRPGITLRPQTPIDMIEKYFELVDLVLIMTVNPGWGGQAFMSEQLSKVEAVKTWAQENNPKLLIEVDGGINPKTAKECRKAGANVFVAGSAIFGSDNYAKAIKEIRGDGGTNRRKPKAR